MKENEDLKRKILFLEKETLQVTELKDNIKHHMKEKEILKNDISNRKIEIEGLNARINELLK